MLRVYSLRGASCHVHRGRAIEVGSLRHKGVKFGSYFLKVLLELSVWESITSDAARVACMFLFLLCRDECFAEA